MQPLRETEKFKRGQNGERVVANLLKQRGWFVIPSYDYSGEDGNKAPKMEGCTAALVIPDLDIAKAGERRWAEVKTKALATLHRKTGVLEHGIPVRHWHHYQQVEAETGCPVWIFIYEESTGAVMCAEMRALGGGRVYDGPKMSRGGMVFWPRDRFRVFCRLPAGAAA